MYQKIIRWCFKFFQARLRTDGQSVHRELTTPHELRAALEELHDYNELETSVVTHNIDQPNQYMCLLYIGRGHWKQNGGRGNKGVA